MRCFATYLSREGRTFSAWPAAKSKVAPVPNPNATLCGTSVTIRGRELVGELGHYSVGPFTGVDCAAGAAS